MARVIPGEDVLAGYRRPPRSLCAGASNETGGLRVGSFGMSLAVKRQPEQRQPRQFIHDY